MRDSLTQSPHAAPSRARLADSKPARRSRRLFPDASPEVLFRLAVVLTTAALFALGVLKSSFSDVTWARGGTEFVLLGAMVCITSYVLGALVSELTAEYFGH